MLLTKFSTRNDIVLRTEENEYCVLAMTYVFSNRFLRLFFFLKTAENKEYSGNGFCRARIIM